MILEFQGGAGSVTGSCFVLENGDAALMVDCGMFQGRDADRLNRRSLRSRRERLGGLVLTHAHIDHVGLLPRLCREGYSGPVHCTRAAADLVPLMLMDAAHIQEAEAEWHTRRSMRAGQAAVEPLYTAAEAQACARLLAPHAYDEPFEAAGFRVILRDAGHILGSAHAEVEFLEGGFPRTAVFSGDVGSLDQAVVRDPTPIREADVLLVESTYGDRVHRSHGQTMEELAQILEAAWRDRGNVVIPAFALGRTQSLLYHLRELHDQGRLPPYRIFVDSPLAISATDIYRRNTECFDSETLALLARHEDPFEVSGMQFARSVDESMRINEVKSGAMIISASGMCNAGRVRHHLKHNLWRDQCHVIFIGFQAEGTPGRAIVDGAKKVKLFGETIAVKAKIHTLGGFSAHADSDQLLQWVSHFEKPGMRVFVVHGEERTAEAFASRLRNDLGLKVSVPRPGDRAEI